MKKQMTDNQLKKAVDEFNEKNKIVKIRGGRSSEIHNDKKKYSKKERKKQREELKKII
jgi:hypothetical protein